MGAKLKIQKLGFPGENMFIVNAHRKQPDGSYRNYVQADGIGTATPADTPVDNGGGVMNPPALPTLPIFPDFTIMTCQELLNTITDLKTTLNAPSFVANSSEWTLAYTNAIATCQALYDSKGCALSQSGSGGTTDSGGVKSPPIVLPPNPPGTTVIIGGTVTPLPAGSGAIFGGSGGGGAAPSATTATKAAATGKKSYTWLWIAAAVAAGYYFFAGKDSKS